MLRRILALLAVIAACGAAMTETASATTTKTVTYHGYRVTVPASWPVLSSASTCVRFNRHAVYLGVPTDSAACPVAAAGRTEALLIQPLDSAVQAVSGANSATVVDHQAGVLVTATWRAHPAVVRTALGRRSLSGLSAAPRLPRREAPARRIPHLTGGPATPGQVYDGPGYDACSAPSLSTMSAWTSSPYSAVGVYIGGQNRACSQANLTSSWVTSVSAAGWHLIPIYVGLQAPTNSCGCAAMSSAQAATQGAAAAAAAVTEMQGLGLGAGNPIYFDMEGYNRTASNTTPVLAFLQAWDQGLAAEGYLSGVYSSDDSGIADLASQYGTGYVEPTDIWFAAWNGGANTNDTVLSPTQWANAQRIHQYSGNDTATYGGVKQSIDEDYLDAPTAGAGSASLNPTATAPPAASSAPTVSGAPVAHQTLSETHATWTNFPSLYTYQWYLCNSIDQDCGAIPGATGPTYKIPDKYADFTIEVSETASNGIGSGTPVMSTPTAVISGSLLGYWAYTSSGGVYNSLYEPAFGQVSSPNVNDIVGMAVDPNHAGYWLVAKHGTVLAYGAAPKHPAIRPAHSIGGIVPTRHGGYWLWTPEGNVYPSSGSGSYGSPVISGYRHIKDIVGMASTPDGKGYWLVTVTGTVFAYGDARYFPKIKVPAGKRIRGIVATPHGGYWLYTAQGNVYPSRGVSTYGGPITKHVTVAGLVPTLHGQGYWIVSTTGQVFAYGKAPSYPALNVTSGVIGLTG